MTPAQLAGEMPFVPELELPAATTTVAPFARAALMAFCEVMPQVPATSVFAALLIWRLFYLILPLILSLPVVLLFERSQLGKASRDLKPPAGLH